MTHLLGALEDQTGFFAFGFYAIAGACLLGLVATIVLEGMGGSPTRDVAFGSP